MDGVQSPAGDPSMHGTSWGGSQDPQDSQDPRPRLLGPLCPTARPAHLTHARQEVPNPVLRAVPG